MFSFWGVQVFFCMQIPLVVSKCRSVTSAGPCIVEEKEGQFPCSEDGLEGARNPKPLSP